MKFHISFFLLIIYLQFLPITVLNAQDFWEKTTGPFGGYVHTITADSAGVLFAGTDNGLYTSTDLGGSWLPYIEQLRHKEITLIEIYMDNIFVIVDYFKLVRISDDGMQLDTITYPSFDSPRTIAFKKDSTLFLGTSYNIYSSTDFGSTWVSLKDSNMYLNYSNKIVIKNDSIIFFSVGNEIYKSENNGDSWQLINEYFLNAPVNTIYLDDEGFLYAANNNYKIFKTTDDGESWQEFNNSPGGVHSILKKENIIFLGTTSGIYKTYDGGNTWLNYSNGLIGFNSCLYLNDSVLTAGTYGAGIFFWNDNNSNWDLKVNGLDAAGVTFLLTDLNNNVFSGIEGMGVFISKENNPLFWEHKNGLSDPEVYSIAISENPVNYNQVYVSTRYGIQKTTNLGETWIDTNAPCWNGRKSICINDSGFIFMMSDCGVFRKKADAGDWDLMNSNHWSGYLKGIGAHPRFPDIYLSSEDRFYSTTNNGTSWRTLPNSGSDAFRIKLNSKGQIYLLTNSDYIRKSSNSGTTFITINSGLPSGAELFDLAFNSSDDIYLATSIGLYVSKNEGSSWDLVDDSNISKNINVLEFDKDDKLYAGLINGGVYKSTNILLDTDEPENKIKDFFLYQNYPNPFNPITVINWQMPAAGVVTLKVYDILGEEVATLVNDYKTEGKHFYEFNAQHLSSGIYFYTLTIGSFTEIKKMLLLK